MKLSVLILGVSGMLGHTLFSRLCHQQQYEVRGTARKKDSLARFYSSELLQKITGGVDADNFDAIIKVLAEFRPDCVINCIGIIKQLSASAEHIPALSVNSLFPHRLAMLCKTAGARLIHISSDCVFDGMQGNYRESDTSNASDLYGRTKFLGEVDAPDCVTLRTSIIGHELDTRYGLVEWFLAQNAQVPGYTRAIFSGFPTTTLADIIIKYLLTDRALHGLYHLSSVPISKYDLLEMIARQYGKEINVTPHSDFLADRSLDSQRFRQATGYQPPSWEELIREMHNDFMTAEHYRERHAL